MKLAIREIAWAMISGNALKWNLEYRNEMNLGPDIGGSVDMLYSGRCNDQVNRATGVPVPLDETVILLDRFWARECEAAKSEDFRARVAQIVSRYEDIVFEASCTDARNPERKSSDVPSAPPEPEKNSGAESRPHLYYGHSAAVEVLSPHLLRITFTDEEGASCKVLLDPAQSRGLHEKLGAALSERDGCAAGTALDNPTARGACC